MVEILMRVSNETANLLKNVAVINHAAYTLAAPSNNGNMTSNFCWNISSIVSQQNNPSWLLNQSKSAYQIGLDTAMQQIHNFIIIIAVSAMAWFLLDAFYNKIKTAPTSEMSYLSVQFFVYVALFAAKVFTVSISFLLLLLTFHLIPLK